MLLSKPNFPKFPTLLVPKCINCFVQNFIKSQKFSIGWPASTKVINPNCKFGVGKQSQKDETTCLKEKQRLLSLQVPPKLSVRFW